MRSPCTSDCMPQPRRTALTLIGACALGCSAGPWAQAVGATPTAMASPKPMPIPVPPPLGLRVVLPELAMISEPGHPALHLAGQVTVLYWWASWCPFCREQTPQIQTLWAQQARHGLQVLGISVDRQAHTARAYLKQGGYTFPCAWYDERLAGVFAKPSMIPSTAVVDRQAQVVQSERGQMFPEDVAALARWLTRS
jgi:peroxiredoxin